MTVVIRWRTPRNGANIWLSRIFFAIGCAFTGYCLAQLIDLYLYRSLSIRKLSRSRIGEPRPASGIPISLLEVPRLDLQVPVGEGTSARTLSRGAGHIAGTAFPEEPGNVGIAGHRDTVFRKLSRIQTGDTVLLVTATNRYRYQVAWTRIVSPADVGVLAGSEQAELTLVTCYPFWFVGPAPKRFVIRARRVGIE